MASTDRPRRPSGALVFGLAWVGYLAAAVATILHHNLVMGDAVSRLANASYAIRGRDPHLTAIGFVWNPLPTLSMIPELALRGVWERLGEPGYAASIASATAMAIAVTALHRITVRWGLSRGARWVVVASFGLNPLVLLYATNGMSEAFVLATLVPAVGALAAWIENPANDLALARIGVLLGLAYLVRYEALAATAGACLAVAVTTLLTNREGRWVRRIAGDIAVVLVPSILAFVVFAGSSWLITGSLTEQFTSSYGNTAVIASAGTAAGITGLQFALSCLAVLAPSAGILIALVVVRGDPVGVRRAAAVLALLGPVLAAAVLFQYSGSTLPFLRFFITAVPLHILMALAATQPRSQPTTPSRRETRARGRVAALALVGLLGAVTAGAGMLDPEVGIQEHHLASLLEPGRDRIDERAVLRAFQTEQRLAAWLDQQQLGEGSILVDVLFGFPVVLSTDHPERFVIPSDRDWAQVLARPQQRGVQLLLTIDDDGRGANDALNRRFPGVFDGRAAGTDLRLELRNDGAGPDWRVYRLLPERAGPTP